MLGFSSPDDCRQAKEVFDRGDYSFEAITSTLGEEEWFTLQAIDLPRFQRHVRDPSPHHTLIRLFLLGSAVSAEAARSALQPMVLEQWMDAGLVRPTRDAESVASSWRFTPVQELLCGSDCPQLDTTQVPDDFVMPPSGTSLMLGWSAIPETSGRTLDLGTGCGYLGMMASRFSDRVIATDHNQRAVEMARFNALLNGVDRVETRRGNLWEPVRGEQFNLVLSNPPFVISPQRRFMFRDSGMRGDQFCRRLMREVPAVLAEGGFCQMLANYAPAADTPWREDLAGWFTDLGCDALVLVSRRQPVDKYAMNWITSTESQDVTVVPRLFDEWMDYFERERIEEVSYLVINVRRRRGVANWTYIDDEEVRVVGPCGASIRRRFAALDYLAELPGDEALLSERLMLAPSARLVQEHAMTSDGPRVAGNRLEMTGGLRHSARLDANVVRFLVYCDGQQPLRSTLAALAESLGLEIDRLASIVLPVVRHLIERGLLLPPHLVPPSSRE